MDNNELAEKVKSLEESLEKIVDILEISYKKFNELLHFNNSLKEDLELVYSALLESDNKWSYLK